MLLFIKYKYNFYNCTMCHTFQADRMPPQAPAGPVVTEQVASDSNEDIATTSSQSSQASIPEQQISIWSDEKEEQQEKRETLNNAISNLTGGSHKSHTFNTEHTSWNDISSTQHKYYHERPRKLSSRLCQSLVLVRKKISGLTFVRRLG